MKTTRELLQLQSFLSRRSARRSDEKGCTTLRKIKGLPLLCKRPIKNIVQVHYPRVSALSAHPLTKKPEDSGYEIGRDVYKTWTSGPWTTSVDPVHGPLHGAGPWTTTVDHPSFCKVTSRKIFRRKREVILALIWTI